jgi:membrane protein implicated in regulation of membrane protease activity
MNWKAIILLIAILFVTSLLFGMFRGFASTTYGYQAIIQFVAFIVISIFIIWLYHHFKKKGNIKKS